MLTLIFIILLWHAIGWGIVIASDLVQTKRIKSSIDKLNDLATKWESKSPYLALLIFFGPIGLMYKNSLYGKKD